jgi:hypothetical protein
VIEKESEIERTIAKDVTKCLGEKKRHCIESDTDSLFSLKAFEEKITFSLFFD